MAVRPRFGLWAATGAGPESHRPNRSHPPKTNTGTPLGGAPVNSNRQRTDPSRIRPEMRDAYFFLALARLEALRGLIFLLSSLTSALMWVAKLQGPKRHLAAGSG